MKYQNKRRTVEAIQIIKGSVGLRDEDGQFQYIGEPGMWIVKDEEGNLSLVPDAVFRRDYEPVGAQPFNPIVPRIDPFKKGWESPIAPVGWDR